MNSCLIFNDLFARKSRRSLELIKNNFSIRVKEKKRISSLLFSLISDVGILEVPRTAVLDYALNASPDQSRTSAVV